METLFLDNRKDMTQLKNTMVSVFIPIKRGEGVKGEKSFEPDNPQPISLYFWMNKTPSRRLL